MDPKSNKGILVSYSHEQKGYKCYNYRTKEVQVSRDVEFDESTSWYSLPTPTPDNSDHPIIEDEAIKPNMIREEEEEDIKV